MATEPEPRDITVVIDNIVARLEAVPGYRPGTYRELYGATVRLNKLKESCMFTAPEAMRMRWFQLAELMEEQLADVTPELRDDLARIFCG